MVQSSYPRARSWYWSRPVLLLFVVPSMKDGVSMRVAVVRSLYLACDPPIRRASSQAYNCRTRRKDRVRFDPRTLGHNHGTGHGWCSSYSLCRSYNCQVFVRRYDSRTPKKILFVVPAMSRWSSFVVRVVAILHTNKNQASHTYSHRSVVSKHLDRVLLDEELEGCVDCAPNSDYIYDKK
jgi:hypothetical protein